MTPIKGTTSMSIDECFEQALRSPDPVGQLRSLALELFARGQDRAAVIERFQETRQQLRQLDREADEDSLMDALDCLVGWCRPAMRLLDDPEESAGRGIR
jgi:hypothetical protein